MSRGRTGWRLLTLALLAALALPVGPPAAAQTVAGSSINVTIPDVIHAPVSCSRYPISVTMHNGGPFGRLDDVTMTLLDSRLTEVGRAFPYAATDGITTLTDDLQVCEFRYESAVPPFTLKVDYDAYHYSTAPDETLQIPWTFVGSPTPTPTPTPSPSPSPAPTVSRQHVYFLGPYLTPSRFTIGTRVSVQCKLRYAGKGVAGEPVKIVYAPSGASKQVRTRWTLSSGSVKVTFVPTKSGRIYCRYAGDARHYPATSSIVRLYRV